MPVTEKKALRAEIARRRSLIGKEETARSDKAVQDHLLALPQYLDAKAVFLFVGTVDEIDTRPVILDALSRGKRVCAPRCLRLGVMHAHEITRLADLRDGRYGIQEPGEGCHIVPPEEIDLVVVPCVTSSRTGQRLGYGGGFYDRYLKGRPFVKAVLCREALLSEEIPSEAHDVPVDLVITDLRVYGASPSPSG